MSKPFSLNAADFGKGVLLAVLIAVIGGIQQMLTGHGFDFGSWDWAMIANLGGSAFVAYLAKNFVSDAQGKPFGKAHQ